MANEVLLRGNEYDPVKQVGPNERSNELSPEIITLLKDSIMVKPSAAEQVEDPAHNPATLGLHFGRYGDLCLSHFVGYVRLKPEEDPNSYILIGEPKKFDTQNATNAMIADYYEMFVRCLEDPIVSRYIIDDCLVFWPDQELIRHEGQFRHVSTILLVSAFLRSLHDLCKRHIRRNFQSTEKNLVGTVKGQIKIGQNIRVNATRGRMDRVYCRFQIHSLDTPENRILRAALEQSMRYMRLHNTNKKPANAKNRHLMWAWAGSATRTLAGVSLRRIHFSEFQRIHCTGLMRPYKAPLKLAKTILRMLGSNPTAEMKRNEYQIPAFALDMNELFERYCEVILRKTLPKGELWAGYQDRNLGKEFKVRPDFIYTNSDEVIIMDAKYRRSWAKNSSSFVNKQGMNSVIKEGVAQVMTYSRHKFVIEKDGRVRSHLKEIYILCPDIERSGIHEQESRPFNNRKGGSNKIRFEEIFKLDFEIPIFRAWVPLPLRESKA